MSLVGMRDRIIRLLGGRALFENVSSGELAAAFGGTVKADGVMTGQVAPWSARIKTGRSTRSLYVLLVIIAVFLGWAAFFQVDKVTRGSGRVLPSVQNQIVQHLEGGIIERLLVREGQRVFKGQVLMHVNNQFTSADYQNARTEVVAKRIALARMEAEVRGASSFTVAPDLAQIAPEIALSEEALFYSRRSQIGNESGIMDQQARARRAEIASLNSRLGNLRNEERLLMTQLDKLERAYRAEAISERDVLDKRSALLQLQTRIADVINQIPQSSAQLGEVSVRRSEVWSRQMQETKTKAAQLRLELAKADESLGAYKDKQQREVIRAPMDGVVNKLYIQTVGGVIRGGEPLAEIVPIDKTVMIEARVAPKDRGNIWTGLPSSIKISAYDSAVYGALEGKVIDVSADVIQDPKGESFYRVRLRADTSDFGKGKPVIPGMTAEVNIRSGRQTILEYILGPIIQIRDNALRE